MDSSEHASAGAEDETYHKQTKPKPSEKTPASPDTTSGALGVPHNFFKEGWLEFYFPAERPEPEYLGPGKFLYTSVKEQARELAVDTKLARAMLAHATGRLHDCEKLAQDAAERARPLGFAPLVGRCEYWVGVGTAGAALREGRESVALKVKELWGEAIEKMAGLYPEYEMAKRDLAALQMMEKEGSKRASGAADTPVSPLVRSYLVGEVDELRELERKKREGELRAARKLLLMKDQLERDRRALDKERAELQTMMQKLEVAGVKVGLPQNGSSEARPPRRHSFSV